MSWALIAAGAMILAGSFIHGMVGDRIVRRVDPTWLGDRARFLIRVTWHFTTIAFIVLGIALVVTGLNPESNSARGVGYVAGALVSCWSAFALVAGFMRGGVRGWTTHPAPFILATSAALIWWGTGSL